EEKEGGDDRVDAPQHRTHPVHPVAGFGWGGVARAHGRSAILCGLHRLLHHRSAGIGYWVLCEDRGGEQTARNQSSDGDERRGQEPAWFHRAIERGGVRGALEPAGGWDSNHYGWRNGYAGAFSLCRIDLEDACGAH